MASASAISTDAQCRALKPAANTFDVRVEKSPGLYLRVHPSARKSWVLRYRNEAGDERRMPLGDYPAVKLAAARNKTLKLKARVSDGEDPFGERSARRHELRHGDTLEQLAEAYFTASATGLHGGRRRPRRPGAIEVDRQRFRTHIKPKLGDRSYKALTRSDVRIFMHALVEETELAAATVAGIGGLLRSILQYAVRQDLLTANPAHELTRPVTPKARERRFSEDLLRVLWPALIDASTASPRTYARKDEPEPPSRAPVEPATAVALRLLGLTLVRRSELAGGKWSEIDMAGGLWTIPASRMKAQREHVVPLSKPALALLRHLRTLTAESESAFILPASGDAQKHMDPRAITRGMSRTIDAFKQPAGSPHDLRRTAATWLTSHGVRRFVVSWLLAHAAHEGAEVTAVYDKNEYLDERRAALELWGEYLDKLAPPPVSRGNVVALKSRGRA